MNTWETMTEPDDSIFEGNTDSVSYVTPDGKNIELGKCHYFKGIRDDEGKYLFSLNPVEE